MEINDGAKTLNESFVFDKTRTLSYIIENDEDYGSKLTELLSHNSNGVPALSISKIGISNKVNDFDNKEIESLIDVLFSRSEVIDASKIEFSSCSNSDFPDEYESSNHERENGESKNDENEINTFTVVPGETINSLINSNRLDSYFDSIYGECDRVTDDGLEFTIEQKQNEASGVERGYESERSLLDDPDQISEDVKLGNELINENGDEKSLYSDQVKLSESEEYAQYTDNTTGIGQTYENSGHKGYSENNEKLGFNCPNVNDLALNDGVKKFECEFELNVEHSCNDLDSNVGTEVENHKQQEMTEMETVNPNHIGNQDNIAKWKLRISDIIRNENEFSQSNNSNSYTHLEKTINNRSNCTEKTNSKNITYLGTSNCQRAHSKGEFGANGYAGGLNTLVTTASRDLKSDVINEIENELKNCRLSLDFHSNEMMSDKNTNSDNLNLVFDNFCMDDDELSVKYDPEARASTNKCSLVSSQGQENNDTDFCLKNSILSSTLNISRVSDSEHKFNYNLSTYNPKLHACNLVEKNDEIDFSKTLNLTNNSTISKDFCLENTLILNSNTGINVCKDPNFDKIVNLEETMLDGTKINGSSNIGVGTPQPETPDPSDIVAAIKILAIVKDVKRQISLIKSKRFVE
ncbi:hypothetical protein FG386_001711 [Cryptosporidium ryanae]|uniref:uncharacterized protein n=1 Tax=Cryptosporidium ryanae TaxID=515981 RepID=UPI003519F935|nr:hypothetical protein FG386_001711 [Cryptosporidium ryanae]